MLTAKDLEKQTRPRKNGASDGKKDFPGPDALPYASETEQEINSLCQDEIARERGRFAQAIEKTRNKIAAARSSIPTNIASTAEAIKAGLKGILARHAGGIRQAADDVERRSKDFRQFRVVNELTYEPDYDDSMINLVGMGALIVTLESAANAYFFGEASDRGFAGGFFTAGMISLANVGVGFLTGLFLIRQFNHIQRWRLIFTLPLLTLIIPGAVAFNLIVGHYREALLKDPDAIILEIIPGAMAHLFDIRSLQSIILVLVGLVIFILSAQKGYKVCDPYPGYMSKHRKMKLAEDRLEEERKRADEDVDDELGSEIGAFAGIGPTLKTVRSALDSASFEIAGALTALNASIEQTEQVGNTTMKLYRSANLEVRSTRVPPPRYFQADFKLDRVSQTAETSGARDEITAAYAQLAVAEQDFQSAQAMLAKERTAIMEQLDDTIARAEADAKARAKVTQNEEMAAREAVRAASA